ncbi:MAG: ABC transporter ATP-binding protein [Flavobacteriales bacterium]|nr:ABC transporter ATP-binding protein [Flavobacteriales bacterium]
MIKADNIHKKYGDLQVLKGVSLEVKKGEVISIVGASGAGKTTLLHILGTLDIPDSGTLSIDGNIVSDLSKNDLAAFRNQRIGFIFQFHHLLPEFTALENVSIPALIGKKDMKETEKKAKEILSFLGLGERFHHKPAALSGGEQQRVAVARALINDPAVVFADEPSGNLDSANARELHEMFFKLRDDFDQTFVIVTHNEELAQMADRSLLIKDGQIEN